MTNTHELKDLEKLIFEKLDILQNGETKAEKKKARTEIIRLEKLIKDVNYKKLNGHKYPEHLYHSDDKPMNKKEIYKLIDSVENMDNRFNHIIEEEYDLTGEFVKPHT